MRVHKPLQQLFTVLVCSRARALLLLGQAVGVLEAF